MLTPCKNDYEVPKLKDFQDLLHQIPKLSPGPILFSSTFQVLEKRKFFFKDFHVSVATLLMSMTNSDAVTRTTLLYVISLIHSVSQ